MGGWGETPSIPPGVSGGPKMEPGVWLGNGTTVDGGGNTGTRTGAGWINIGDGCR